LSEFFFQRHLGEECVDTLLDVSRALAVGDWGDEEKEAEDGEKKKEEKTAFHAEHFLSRKAAKTQRNFCVSLCVFAALREKFFKK